MVQVPQADPGFADKARELWYAAQAVGWQPTFWQFGTPPNAKTPLANGQAVRSRPAGKENSVWWTNWAFWSAYPDTAQKIAEGDAAASNAWNRINAAVNSIEDSDRPANPNYNPAGITWPLLTQPTTIRPGARFGAKRPAKGAQTRKHTGCDLAANLGAGVLAPESGTVVAPNSGWEMKKVNGVWKGVKSLILRTDSGRTWLLGGIRPDSAIVKKDERVVAGQRLAEVGAYPGGSTMLHVTLYDAPLTEAQVNQQKSWSSSSPAPKNLIDPQPFLEAASKNPRAMMMAMAVPANENIEDAEQTEGTPEGAGPDDAEAKGTKKGLVAGGIAALIIGVALRGR